MRVSFNWLVSALAGERKPRGYTPSLPCGVALRALRCQDMRSDVGSPNGKGAVDGAWLVGCRMVSGDKPGTAHGTDGKLNAIVSHAGNVALSNNRETIDNIDPKQYNKKA